MSDDIETYDHVPLSKYAEKFVRKDAHDAEITQLRQKLAESEAALETNAGKELLAALAVKDAEIERLRWVEKKLGDGLTVLRKLREQESARAESAERRLGEAK